MGLHWPNFPLMIIIIFCCWKQHDYNGRHWKRHKHTVLVCGLFGNFGTFRIAKDHLLLSWKEIFQIIKISSYILNIRYSCSLWMMIFTIIIASCKNIDAEMSIVDKTCPQMDWNFFHVCTIDKLEFTDWSQVRWMFGSWEVVIF